MIDRALSTRVIRTFQPRARFVRLLLSHGFPIGALLTLLLVAANPVRSLGAAEEPPDYELEIKPILRDRCFSCHSRLKQKAKLRLDAGLLIRKGGEHGPSIVPGQSRESLLIQRVLSRDEDERMPPDGKPLPENKIALLQAWIDAGARFPKDEPVPRAPADHWAFQPIRSGPVPTVNDSTLIRNPIDRFVFGSLEQRQWQPALPAEPGALLRRLYLDLTGLPPTTVEQEFFLKNPSPERLDQVVGELLARPTYGERWARHWLDVVRYADSNGYERDAEKPFVWRYRDYVIDALNQDKPFERFVLEQLAGDELPDASAETMIATTYLRLGHWDDEPADPPTDRFDQLDDIVSTSAQVFLGLTLGCARCHDHKFEPLTSRDYYSMIAVFNPLERPRKGRTELALPVGTSAELEVLAARDRQIEDLKHQTPPLSPEELAARIKTFRDATPDLPQAYIWRESGSHIPATHILPRGSVARPGEAVEPSVPAIVTREKPAFPSPDQRTSKRRLGLARWLVSPDNPLTARVLVNRVWQHHFGHGLVRTPNDFGLMGDPPTHPELLDWLAFWFVHDAGWSLKKLHRLILTSTSWRMSSRVNRDFAADDPEDRWLWRKPSQRLEVEALRDSILAVSGRLNRKMLGPAMKPSIPKAAIEANTDKESSWHASDAVEASRRTIYAFLKRGLVMPMLEVFDLADTVSSCPQRQVTTVAPQALNLFNSEFIQEQSVHFAARLRAEAGPDVRTQIDLAWRLALCRPPTPTETTEMTHFCRDETEALIAEAGREGRIVAKEAAARAALAQMCRVILNLNEFVYPE